MVAPTDQNGVDDRSRGYSFDIRKAPGCILLQFKLLLK